MENNREISNNMEKEAMLRINWMRSNWDYSMPYDENIDKMYKEVPQTIKIAPLDRCFLASIYEKCSECPAFGTSTCEELQEMTNVWLSIVKWRGNSTVSEKKKANFIFLTIHLTVERLLLER